MLLFSNSPGRRWPADLLLKRSVAPALRSSFSSLAPVNRSRSPLLSRQPRRHCTPSGSPLFIPLSAVDGINTAHVQIDITLIYNICLVFLVRGPVSMATAFFSASSERLTHICLISYSAILFCCVEVCRMAGDSHKGSPVRNGDIIIINYTYLKKI